MQKSKESDASFVRGAPFDFDGDTLYQGNAEKNRDHIHRFLQGHVCAIAVSYTAVKLMLFIMDGGANALLYWAAMKLFGPLMDGLRW